MVTLLDTDRMPVADRRPAQVAARLEASMVSHVRIPDAGRPVRARLDHWELGGLAVLRTELSGELVLTRSGRRAADDVEPTVSFAIQERGVALHAQFDRRRVVPRGGLALTELTSAYEYHSSEPGTCRALQLPVGRLGLSVDAVRRALPRVHRSPMYGLVRAHLEQVTRDVELLAGDPMAGSVAVATAELARALLASADGGRRAPDDVAAGTLLALVRGYVRRHLTDPELDVESIAAAHAISVRQLYRLCSAAGFSLEQWIIDQRLDGARGELSDPAGRDRPIAAVARRWGFSDPSYFSRRFRRSFGLTPRDWRRADAGPVAIPAPRGELVIPAAGRPGAAPPGRR